MSIAITSKKNCLLLLPKLNKRFSSELKDEWFDIEYWQQLDSVIGHSRGRSVTWFVACNDEHWVLRHYHRGGLVARLLGDQYLYTGVKNTRCYRELALLEQMHSQGLAVPKPVAARVIRRGLFYTADLLIEKIPGAHDLVTKLIHSPLEEIDWHSLGAIIAKFHQAGIYHSDLNAHNILLDEHFNFWLIDFDKCGQRKVKKDWQQKNLNRLHRSFVKEKSINSELHFDKQCWSWLLQGYKSFYHLSVDARH